MPLDSSGGLADHHFLETHAEMVEVLRSLSGLPGRREVLVARLVPGVGGLRAIAEIIHDIDLKDSKFERTEAAGIDALITGICTHYKDDDERLQRGSAIFDDLFESFSRRRR